MASIGEKIKEVFTGHSHSEHNDASDVKTPDVDAPGAYPSDKPTHKDSELLSKPNKASSGHKHSDSGVEIGRGHHDPEIDAKQATSAAGNYPYWGDLSREDERDSDGNPHVGHAQTSHHNPGIASGAKAIDVGESRPGHLASKDGSPSDLTHRTAGMPQNDMPDRTRDTMGTTNPTSSQDDKHTSHHKGEAAAATGAGALGAGYLASHHKYRPQDTADQKTESGQSQSGSSGFDRDYSSNPGFTGSTTSGPATTATTTSPAHRGNHKRDEGLAAGAGAAGLGAASYMAMQKHDDQFLPEDRPTTTYGSGYPSRDSTQGQAAIDPMNDRSAHNNKGGIHNTVIGAGSAEHPEPHRSAPTSSSTNAAATTVGPHSTPATFDQQRYDPTEVSAAPTSGSDRDRQGVAAAAGVGAGAGAVGAAEHKHQHQHHVSHHDKSDGSTRNGEQSRPFANKINDDDYRGASTRHGQSQSQSQPAQPAYAAAAQAWNNQDGQAQPGDETRSKYGPAAAGLAGAGTAGAIAAYYGQGKEHDQNPRSDGSERIAERALGDDGTAQAPSSQGHSGGQMGRHSSPSQHAASSRDGSGLQPAALPSSTGAGGRSPGHGVSSKVVHKCHQCGADNDISNYFDKDAIFRTGV